MPRRPSLTPTKVKRKGVAAPSPLSARRNDDSVDAIRAFLGMTLDTNKYKQPAKPSKRRKVVALGDLHGNPHPALLPLIIAEQPDHIEVGGDIYDLACFSAHPRGWDEEKDEFGQEHKRVTAYFETLLLKTPAQIIIRRGNHDDRFWRRICDYFPAAPRSLFNDPLDLLVSSLASKRIATASTDVTAHHPRLSTETLGKVAYLGQLGDAIISHCNFSGSEPGAAVGKLSKWLDEWHQLLGWPEPTLCIQFHSHQWSYQFKRGGFLALVEPGMAGMPVIEGYKVGYQAKWKPGTLGAVSFVQEKVAEQWVTCLDTVHPLIP